MSPLTDQLVIAVEEAADSALARCFASWGARVRRVAVNEVLETVPHAQFLIDRLGLERLGDLGVTPEAVRAANPALVHVSVSAFGSHGPRSRWLGSELLASAMGGVLILTGDPDRPPVKEALDACFFHADMAAIAGAMSAHYERAVSGLGQHVDVSAQEVAFSRCINSILVWQFDRRKLARVGGALNYGKATVRCIWPLADGFCFHTLMTGRFGAPANQALSDWMDEANMPNPLCGVDWLRYDRSTLDPALRREWESAIEAFFRTLPKSQLAHEGRRRGINATVVNAPKDVLDDAHLAHRGFWRTHQKLRVPGRFVGFSAGGALGSLPPGARPQRPGPLSGIRVLDFSWALVGSITTKVLGDLGAEVIKVESRTRPCLSRLDVQVSASKPGNFDDKPWFAHLNSSKRSLALDMKQPQGRELLEPLIRWADVVVENFSPGTMSKLGLSYEQLSALNPAVVMVSGSVFGQTGPMASEWGIDGTGAALAGRTFLTGWPDRNPVIPGAVPYGDVIVPYVMAAAVAAALAARRRTGQGCHIDASMYEICVQQMHESILKAQQGSPPVRSGNQAAGFFRQGVYPVSGTDRWIALTCPTIEDWLKVLKLAQLAASSDESAFANWSAQQPGAQLMAALQQAGIRAALVQDIEELMQDPQLLSRGALMELPHPALGPFGHVRTPLTFSRTVCAPYRAPAIGEHSRQIAAQMGLSQEQIEALERGGVFT